MERAFEADKQNVGKVDLRIIRNKMVKHLSFKTKCMMSFGKICSQQKILFDL